MSCPERELPSESSLMRHGGEGQYQHDPHFLLSLDAVTVLPVVSFFVLYGSLKSYFEWLKFRMVVTLPRLETLVRVFRQIS